MKKSRQVFLGGGGSPEDSRVFDVNFVTSLNLKKPLIYLPNAMEKKRYPACLKWFASVMSPLGVSKIEMWTDLSHPGRPIGKIAGIYIGGGNTAKLLQEVSGGFDTFLLKAIKTGLPVYGGSAGAIILGADIRTSPEGRKMNGVKAKGLGAIGGYSIACHFKDSQSAKLISLAKKLGQKIIAIPETSGALVSGKSLINLGTGTIVIFSHEDPIKIHSGEAVKLRLADFSFL